MVRWPAQEEREARDASERHDYFEQRAGMPVPDERVAEVVRFQQRLPVRAAPRPWPLSLGRGSA